jgi:hypothetical protein
MVKGTELQSYKETDRGNENKYSNIKGTFGNNMAQHITR